MSAHQTFDLLHDTVWVRQHVVVPEPDDQPPSCHEFLSPSLVGGALLGMLPAIDLDDEPCAGAGEIGDIGTAIARPARMLGGRDWVRIGAAELALDALRRRLAGLPVDERIDFERR